MHGINEIDRNYQWCYLLSIGITLYGVRSTRYEVSHKTDEHVENKANSQITVSEIRDIQNRMATKQNMMQAITQTAIQAGKAAIMAVKEIENPVNATRLVQIMPKTGGPTLKQQTFNCKVANKYQGPQDIKKKVKNIFMTNSINIKEIEKVPIVFNWLGRERERDYNHANIK